MQDFTEIFDSLSRPESTKGTLSFSAVQLKDTPHRIGKDSSGWPALLLKSSSEQRGAQILLEHLDIQHFVRCRIINKNKDIEEGLYTVIRCTEADDELSHYFLYILGPVLKLLGKAPTFSEISRTIAYLVELFRALTEPPMKSVSGLWAELFLIRKAKDPELLLNSWHSTPEEKYDFSSGIQRIEVKSTSQRKRIHHFSLEQLTPPMGCRIIIASFFVERSGGGLSLGKLLQEIRELFAESPESQEKLNRIVALTLGSALQKSLTSRFDQELAQESLQIFNGEIVPKIQGHLPQEISEVHFKSDLTQCKSLPKKELLDAGGIFACLI